MNLLLKTLVLILIFRIPLALASEDALQEIKTADYVMENMESIVHVKKNGTFTMKDTVSYRVQTEKGRIELGLREIRFVPRETEVKVLDAYTLNDGQISPTLLKKVTIRSESAGTTGLRDDRKVIIPFNNVKVGSLIVYTYETKVKKALVPGSAFLSMVFGIKEPELKNKIEIFSESPLKYTVYDKDQDLHIKESKEGKRFRYSISTVRPIYKLPKLKKANLIESGDLPMILMTSAANWGSIVNSLSRKYESAIEAPLPLQFQQIVAGASKLKTDVEKINFVSVNISNLIAYSGEWTNPTNRYFPKGHQEVVKNAKGDCKDFATSVAGILRKMGFEASVALVVSGSPTNRLNKDVDLSRIAPTGDIFNHAITYVKVEKDKVFWVDATHPVEYADGIWPEIADSPALILQANTTDLVRVPSQDQKNSLLNLVRNVTLLSNDKAEWKGLFQAEGSTALETMQQYKLHGKAKMELAFPKYILREAAQDGSRMPLKEEAFTSNKANLTIPFDVVGASPFVKSKSNQVTLDLGIDLSLARYFVDGKMGGAYFGTRSTQMIKTVYNDIVAEDPVRGDCFILSPWLDFERKVEVQGKNTTVTETLQFKQSYISGTEAKSDNYEYFLGNLGSCLRSKELVAHRAADSPVVIPPLSQGAPSKIHTLAISTESVVEAEKLFRDYDEREGSYLQMKTKRIFEKVLETEPKNAKIITLRAMAILRMGYIRGDLWISDYHEYALKEIERAIQIDPHEIEARMYRARLFMNQKKYDQAAQDMIVAYKLDPKRVDVLTRIGEIYAGKKDLKISDQWMAAAKSLASTPEAKLLFWKTQTEIGQLSNDKKKLLEAREELSKLNSDSPWSLHNYAISLSEDGQIDKAIEIEKTALVIMDFGAARSTLSGLLIKKADKLIKLPNSKAYADRQIEELLIESLKYSADSNRAYYLLSWIYINRTTHERETDWLDKSDVYLDEGLKRHPRDLHLQALQKQSTEMKSQILQMFKAKGLKLSGRWPATFEARK